MTPQERRKRRASALSVLRACKRAEERERPQTAKVFGETLIVHPYDVANLRDEYTPWLGSPRYRKSQSKQAVYQRAYRLRQKAKQSPSEDPLFDECCRVAGVQPWSPEGVIVDIVMRHLRTRSDSQKVTTEEEINKRLCYDPVLNIVRPPVVVTNIKTTAPTPPAVKAPKPQKLKGLKFGVPRRPLFGPTEPKAWEAKDWSLDDEDDQPAQKQNLAPKNTTLIQHVFEYTP